MMWNRLDTRLTVSIAGIVALTLLAVTVFLVYQATQAQLSIVDEGLERVAWTVALSWSGELAALVEHEPGYGGDLQSGGGGGAGRPGSGPGTETLLDRFEEAGARLSERLTVVDAGGRVLADTRAGPEELENHRGRPEIREALAGRVGFATRYSATLRTPMRYVAVPVRDGGGRVVGAVRVALPLAEIEARQRRVYRFAALSGLGGLFFALLAAVRLGRQVTEPLARMTRWAEEVAQGRFQHRMPLPEAREMADLTRVLHAMGDRLHRLVAELSQGKTHLEAILDSMSDAVIVVDSRLHVTLTNRAAGELFGAAQLKHGVGRHLAEALRSPAFQDVFTATLEDGKPRRAVLEWPDASGGGERVLQVSTSPLWSAAFPLTRGGVVGLVRDITDLRRLERMRSDFVANASHELRTPLTVLQGFLETLLEGDVPPAQQRRFLEIMALETERMVNLVNDLLQLSSLESGTKPLQREPVDLGRVIAAVGEAFSTALAERRIALVIDVPPDLPPVPAERRLVEQVFHNLMSNAVKYMGDGGGTITIRARKDKRGVHVAVADTGIGIPPEHLPRIFERFYRVDPARSRQQGGTGLGLSIVRHIVERHGGQVWAESQVGEGTTIHFVLPC